MNHHVIGLGGCGDETGGNHDCGSLLYLGLDLLQEMVVFWSTVTLNARDVWQHVEHGIRGLSRKHGCWQVKQRSALKAKGWKECGCQ